MTSVACTDMKRPWSRMRNTHICAHEPAVRDADFDTDCNEREGSKSRNPTWRMPDGKESLAIGSHAWVKMPRVFKSEEKIILDVHSLLL